MSFVYFIGPTDWRVGRVKIGVTMSNPRSRLASFQTGSPYELEIYAFFPGDYNMERTLHEAFAPLRIHGEWFRTDGRLLALVANMYGEKFGNAPHTIEQFFCRVSDVVESDKPFSPHFCLQSEWESSIAHGPLEDWINRMLVKEHERWVAERLA